MKYFILLLIFFLSGCGSSRSTLEVNNRTHINTQLEEKDSTHLYRANNLVTTVDANEIITRRTIQFSKSTDGKLYPTSITDETIDRSQKRQDKNSSTEELNSGRSEKQVVNSDSETNINQEEVKKESSIFQQMAGFLWALFAVLALVGGYLLLKKMRII